jgi:hypothetical protein
VEHLATEWINDIDPKKRKETAQHLNFINKTVKFTLNSKTLTFMEIFFPNVQAFLLKQNPILKSRIPNSKTHPIKTRTESRNLSESVSATVITSTT